MKNHSVQSIASTNIQQIDYDDLRSVLLVRLYDFKTGRSTVYEFDNVPMSVFDSLVKADLDSSNDKALEKTFNDLLKSDKYEYSKMSF